MLQRADIAPDLALIHVNGSGTSLETILSRGKVLLAFFKVGCPTCQLTLPFLERLSTNTAVVQIYGVSQDDAESTKAFCARFGLTFPMLIDEAGGNFEASNAFQITEVPSIFLVNKDREIEWTEMGFSRQALTKLGHELNVAIFRADDRVPEVKPG